MKYLLVIFAILGFTYVQAELPTPTTDNKGSQTSEYLDGKIDKVQGYFSNNKSTATFAGWIDIGWERNTTNCGVTASCVSVCSSGKKILGGGVDSPNRTNLGGSFPSADDRMFCYSDTNNITLTCYSVCARVK